MADLAEVEAAFLKADKAGDFEAASALAGEVHRLRAAPTAPVAATSKQENLPGDALAGNPLTRFALGAASPFIGAAQLAANLFPDSISRPVNEHIAQLEEMKKRGAGDGVMSTIGDVAEIGGGVLSAPGLLAAKLMKPAASFLGRTGQGAAIGAGFGATAPVTGQEDYWNDKAEQTAFGAGVGGAIPAAMKVAGVVGSGARHLYRGTVEPLFQRGRNAAEARKYVKVAGDRAPEIEAALRNPSSSVAGYQPTAAEVIASLPASIARSGQAEMAGLQANVSRSLPSAEAAVLQGQGARLADAIRSFGGDKAGLERAIKDRNAVTGPMRDEAIANANVAGVQGPRIQQALAEKLSEASEATNDVRRFGGAFQRAGDIEQRHFAAGSRPTQPSGGPVDGTYRAARDAMQNAQDVGGPVGGRYSHAAELGQRADAVAGDAASKSLQRGAEARFLAMQDASLGQSGHFPLDSSKIVGQIDKILGTPGDRAVTLNEKVLSAIRAKIRQFTNDKGVIDANDLYAIRKTDINDVVSDLTKDMNAVTKQRAAGLATSIKADIDNAIEAAGGTGWKDYLTLYGHMSRKIDQRNIGMALEEKLTSALSGDAALRPGAFATALRDSSHLPQKSANVPRHQTLEDALTPQNMAKVNAVAGTLETQAAADRLGRAGASRAAEITGVPEIPVPGMVSQKVTIAKHFARILQAKGTSQMDREMARDMLTNPQNVSKLMAVEMRRARTSEEMSAVMRKYSPLAIQGAMSIQGASQ